MKKANVSELIGLRSGMMVAVKDAGQNKNGCSLVLCQCDCGNLKSVTYSHFKAGAYVSCGCKKPTGQYRHGLTKTRTHNIWMMMRRRCEDSKSNEYHRYGALGISVCDRWQFFDKFLEDMGECPKEMSIDRIDNSKGYEPSNCRWATPKQQAENRSTQKFYEIDGETLTLPDVAKKYGINYRTLRNRMFRTGMTLEQAVAHKFGDITDQGMQKLKAAVSDSNKRRGQTTASKGVR